MWVKVFDPVLMTRVLLDSGTDMVEGELTAVAAIASCGIHASHHTPNK